MVEVRPATIFDCSHLYAMLVQMHNEADIRLAEINPIKFSETVSRAVTHGVVLVAVEDKKIIGSIGGMSSTEWWSDEPLLGDLWFYVYPAHRVSRAAIMLIRKFLDVGKGMHIKLGHIYGGDKPRKDHFYAKLGLSLAGSTYILEKT